MSKIAIIEGTKLKVNVPYDQNEAMRALGLIWHGPTRTWQGMATQDVVKSLRDMCVRVVGSTKDALDPSVQEIERNFDNLDIDFTFTGDPPYDHQVYTFIMGTQIKRLPMVLDMGLGKTPVSCWLARYHMEQGHIRKWLVVCTTKTVWQWAKAWERWCPNLPWIVPQGTVAERMIQARSAASGLVVLTYEGITPLKEQKPKPRETVEARQKRESFNMMVRERKHLLDLLTKSFEDQMVVFDESTKVRNPVAQRSKAARKLSIAAKYVMILTGFPAPNGIENLFGQFLVLDGGLTFGASLFGFRRRFMKDIGGAFSKWVPKEDAADEIRCIIKRRGVRFVKDECLDLPPRTFEEVKVELSDEQTEAYRRIQSSNDPPIAKMTKLMEVSAGFLYNKGQSPIEFECPKLEALGEALENTEWAAGHKAIVWCRFTWEVDRAVKLCDKLGLKPGQVKGGYDSRSDIERFEQDPEARVMVCQTQAGSHGLNLTVADYMYYLTNDWDLELRLQSLDRNRRIGQTANQHVVDFVSVHPDGRPTIDSMVLDALRAKKNLAQAVDIKTLADILATH